MAVVAPAPSPLSLPLGTRVLVVDDEADVRAFIANVLEGSGCVCHQAESAREAAVWLVETPFDVILCDVQMPGGSGLDVVHAAHSGPAPTPVVMVSGLDDPAVADQAFALGAYGYLIKPFSINEVRITLLNALRRHALEVAAARNAEALSAAVAERTRELSRALGRLEANEAHLRDSREETIRRLARAAEMRDDDTAGHIHRVSALSHELARRLDLAPAHCELVRLASPLHDVGKIAIPDSVLHHAGPLTPEQRTVMEAHAELGHGLLAGSGQPLLDLAALIARTHHERWDGAGYPHRLAGEAIPLEGRIVAVADVFDALTSERVYRPAFSEREAVQMLRVERGRQFDPVVLDAFLGAVEAFVRVRGDAGAPPACCAA